MTKNEISRWIHMAWDFTSESEESLKRKFEYQEAQYMPYEKFAKLVAEHERTAVLETIEELKCMESDRHPMFSEGYDYALDHIEQFVRGRGEK
jgi:hypothetical protein